MGERDDTVIVQGLKLVAVTAKGYKIEHAGGWEDWLPRSQILDTDMHGVGDEGFVAIPRWLAEEKFDEEEF